MDKQKDRRQKGDRLKGKWQMVARRMRHKAQIKYWQSDDLYTQMIGRLLPHRYMTNIYRQIIDIYIHDKVVGRWQISR